MNDDRFERLENKLDLLTDKQGMLALATQDNTTSLKEHMQQTAEVRKQTQMLFEGLQTLKENMDDRLKPTETFIDRIKFLGAVITFVMSIVICLYEAGFLHK